MPVRVVVLMLLAGAFTISWSVGCTFSKISEIVISQIRSTHRHMGRIFVLEPRGEILGSSVTPKILLITDVRGPQTMKWPLRAFRHESTSECRHFPMDCQLIVGGAVVGCRGGVPMS